jgi:hypothetical protein
MLQPFSARTPKDRKAVVISIVLAVAVHVGLLIMVSEQRAKATAERKRPPGVQGLGSGLAPDGGQVGMAMTKDWNRHRFRVLSELDGKPIAGARVTDVFMLTITQTGADGIAVLPVRPGAKLVVHIERPGYKMVAGEYPNLNRDHEETVVLPVAPVPYAKVDSIFIRSCNYCHGAVGKSGQVDLTNYDRTMTSLARGDTIVVPFNPEKSLLITTLTVLSGPDGKPFPHARVTSQVTEFDIATIAQWIREGAKRR